jgi:hypothetical protein
LHKEYRKITKEAMHIKDTQRLVAEEIEKARGCVLYLVGRREPPQQQEE